MGLAVREAYNLGKALSDSNSLATLGAMLVGMAAFPVLALLTGSIRPDDLKSLPRIGSRAALLFTAYEARRDSLLTHLRKK